MGFEFVSLTTVSCFKSFEIGDHVMAATATKSPAKEEQKPEKTTYIYSTNFSLSWFLELNAIYFNILIFKLLKKCSALSLEKSPAKEDQKPEKITYAKNSISNVSFNRFWSLYRFWRWYQVLELIIDFWSSMLYISTFLYSNCSKNVVILV